MADIEFVQGDYGQNYDITVKDPVTGAAADLTPYTGGTLTIKSTDYSTSVQTVSVTIPAPATQGIARWAMANGQTNMAAGAYVAQIELTGSSVDAKTTWMSVNVIAKA